MSIRTVMLRVPEELYTRIQQRAHRSQRSVEAEFVDVLSAAVPATDELPRELAEAVAALDRLDDTELWRTARRRLPAAIGRKLATLNRKQQRAQGLSDDERKTMEQLSLEYDRSMLVRARAALVLKDRGHDVGRLLTSP